MDTNDLKPIFDDEGRCFTFRKITKLKMMEKLINDLLICIFIAFKYQ